ncbi:hypothetical protein RB213_014848 [Colletotrichum asianum]
MGINTVIAITDRPHLSIHWRYDALASCQVRETTKAPSLFIILGTIQMTISTLAGAWRAFLHRPKPLGIACLLGSISLSISSHIVLTPLESPSATFPCLALPSGCNIRAPGDPSLRLKAIMAPHLGEIWPSPKWDVTMVHLEEE